MVFHPPQGNHWGHGGFDGFSVEGDIVAIVDRPEQPRYPFSGDHHTKTVCQSLFGGQIRVTINESWTPIVIAFQGTCKRLLLLACECDTIDA
jgi:hypothetical protein